MTGSSEFYKKVIAEEIGSKVELTRVDPVSGGCINNGIKLITSEGIYFLKWNSQAGDMFEKESRGLELLRAPGIVTIPNTIGFGTLDSTDYLLMEFISGGPRSVDYWADFGEKLAALHQISQTNFGLDHDNYIGSLAQSNELNSSWVEFFINQRLRIQLDLANDRNLIPMKILTAFDSLMSRLPQLLPEEQPSLLHGDLWSGNVMVGNDGEICLIDPAVYFGHREIELAFTTLFGGFDQAFYQAYNEQFPLTAGYEDRFDICNLYPLLVHLNLFGSSYLPGIQATLKKFS